MDFDHIGVIVNRLEDGVAYFKNVLHVNKFTDQIVDPLQKVRLILAYDENDICYELLSPLSDDSPVQFAMVKKTNIINHIAYRVDDLDAQYDFLRKHGHMPLGSATPAIAFGGKRVQFFLNPLNFVVELIENRNESNS